MPGKHAPASPRSFYLSLARAGGAVALGIVLVVVIVMAATGSKNKPLAVPSTHAPSASARPSAIETGQASATPSAVARDKVTVVVLNGTPRAGIATQVADQLKADGWTDIVFVGNTAAARTTSIGYRSGARALAQELHDIHPELGPIALTADTPKNCMLVVSIGADYPG